MQMSVRQFLCRCRFAEVDSSAVDGDERGRIEELCGCDSSVISWVRHNNSAQRFEWGEGVKGRGVREEYSDIVESSGLK